MKTSEVLNRAADLIEERGWQQGGGWWEATMGVGSLCLEGAVMAAAGVDLIQTRRGCPAFQAVQSYLGRGVVPFAWNDEEGRTATEVVEALRAAAVIEAAKETVDRIPGGSPNVRTTAPKPTRPQTTGGR